VLGDRLPAEKMMTSSIAELSPAAQSSLYARGWLLTHFLTFEPSRQGQLANYIRKLNDGAGTLQSAREAFGDLKQLDRDLDRYMQRKKMSYWNLAADKITIGPITVRDATAAENALMDVKIRSRRGVNEAQAKELLPLVRRAAAAFAKDPFAQATLAEAEFDAGSLAEAEAAADRALAANPKYVDALIYKARAQMAAATKAGLRDKERWSGIRKLIVAANRADPNDPEPLILFYRSFLEQGIEPTPNATQGLLIASAAAPQDRTLRMNVALQMLRDGKAAEARRALMPIAFDPHADQTGKAAAQLLAKLDSDGVKAALDLSSGMPEPGEENEE
jgi:tetratricopeptide (TPR) repeat protein